MKILSEKQREDFDAANICYVCHEKFDSNNRLKLKNRDHCHFTGEFRGAACTWCNLRNKAQKTIPIYFHNFKGYDSKLVLSCLTNFKIKPDAPFYHVIHKTLDLSISIVIDAVILLSISHRPSPHWLLN